MLCTSTTGDAPVTVSVSSSAPTFSSVFTVIVKSDGSSRPSRLTVENPSSVKRQRVDAGPQVHQAVGAVFVGRDRADLFDQHGLAASTVTPGSTAPEVSLTTPVSVLCAMAGAGTTHRQASARSTEAACSDSPFRYPPAGGRFTTAEMSARTDRGRNEATSMRPTHGGIDEKIYRPHCRRGEGQGFLDPVEPPGFRVSLRVAAKPGLFSEPPGRPAAPDQNLAMLRAAPVNSRMCMPVLARSMM